MPKIYQVTQDNVAFCEMITSRELLLIVKDFMMKDHAYSQITSQD